jgi:hypothetical protein
MHCCYVSFGVKYTSHAKKMGLLKENRRQEKDMSSYFLHFKGRLAVEQPCGVHRRNTQREYQGQCLKCFRLLLQILLLFSIFGHSLAPSMPTSSTRLRLWFLQRSNGSSLTTVGAVSPLYSSSSSSSSLCLTLSRLRLRWWG